jgi:hypothetical protein
LPQAVSASPGCSNSCVADSSGGNQYNFNSSDPDLSNNKYDEGTPFPNNSVKNNVYKMRQVTASAARFCGYSSTSYNGSLYGYADNTWSWTNVQVSHNISSVLRSGSHSCP